MGKIAFNFRCFIHTAQLSSKDFSVTPEELKKANSKPFVIYPYARVLDKGYTVPINANKLYGADIESLNEFLLAVQNIASALNIQNYSFDRLDFAFDSKAKFEKIYKPALYITILLSEHIGIKNAIAVQDVRTKDERALFIKNSRFEFQIYDKLVESNGKHPYSRFEFRFKNINVDADIYTIIERLKKHISGLEKVVDVVNENRVNDLYSLYEKHGGNLSEFVRRYSDDVFTLEILKGLYQRVLNGDFNNWLRGYRKKHSITFIKKSDLKRLQNELLCALNGYQKMGIGTTQNFIA